MTDRVKSKGSIRQVIARKNRQSGKTKSKPVPSTSSLNTIPAIVTNTPAPTTQTQKTYVALVLDTSGSMESIRTQAINHFNETVRAIRDKSTLGNQEVVVCLTTFGHREYEGAIRYPQWLVPIDQVKELTFDTYRPESNTPLFQAIGETIEKLRTVSDANEQNVAFLINVITDGHENASRGKYAGSSYTGSVALASLIKEVQGTGRWTVTVQGANFDVLKLAQNLNIDTSNVQSFQSTAAGTAQATAVNVNATQTYMSARSVGHVPTSGFYTKKKSS